MTSRFAIFCYLQVVNTILGMVLRLFRCPGISDCDYNGANMFAALTFHCIQVYDLLFSWFHTLAIYNDVWRLGYCSCWSNRL